LRRRRNLKLIILRRKKKLTKFVQCIYSFQIIQKRRLAALKSLLKPRWVPTMNGFEDFQKLGKDNMDMAMQSFGAANKGFQAIAAEFADFNKKSLEESTAAFEKLVGAKSIDKAIEVQSEFVRSSYETLVGEMTKLGEMYADVAKDAYKPYEGVMAKVSK